MLQRGKYSQSHRIWYGAVTMNRRQVLQSLLGIAAGGTCARVATAFGTLPARNPPNDHISVAMLAALLQETVEFCQTMLSHVRPNQSSARANLCRQCVRSGQICEIALNRLRGEFDRSPAFWQACADSIERLEYTILNADSAIDRSLIDVPRTLRQLRAGLANQTALIIERQTLRA